MRRLMQVALLAVLLLGISSGTASAMHRHGPGCGHRVAYVYPRWERRPYVYRQYYYPRYYYPRYSRYYYPRYYYPRPRSGLSFYFGW
jgi:hypothetical protein